MAGKKYQAESKTVQKMTRNGLVEEDLHSGKTRRAVTHETEGVRIGERPMDTYSDAGSSRGIRDADRSLRLDRRGMQTAGTAQESGHMDDRGHKKFQLIRSFATRIPRDGQFHEVADNFTSVVHDYAILS